MYLKMVSIQEAAEFLGVCPQTLLDGIKTAVEVAQC
jgi:hypothetical protein